MVCHTFMNHDPFPSSDNILFFFPVNCFWDMLALLSFFPVSFSDSTSHIPSAFSSGSSTRG
ncbi:uncharacterized protein BDV14DRAFT_169788 [Aspergillus stella-maris]|uniref:uncharacterized protein n=1 Tax=Aspergillus stella-maris TaxID=1810926 RepID=UPI003CCCCF09